MDILLASPVALGLAIAFVIFFIGLLVASLISRRRKKSGEPLPPPPVTGATPPVKYEIPTEPAVEQPGSVKTAQMPASSKQPLSEKAVAEEPKFQKPLSSASQQRSTAPVLQPLPAEKQQSPFFQKIQKTLPQQQQQEQPIKKFPQQETPTESSQPMEAALSREPVTPLQQQQPEQQQQQQEQREASERSEVEPSPYTIVMDSSGSSATDGKKNLIVFAILTSLLIIGLGALMILVRHQQGILKQAQTNQQSTITPASYQNNQQLAPTGILVEAGAREIRIYDLSWGLLSNEDLKEYKAGDTIRIAVWVAADVEATKARVRIKQGDIYSEWTELDQQRTNPEDPESKEFYFDYKLPSGPTTFTVEAEVFKDGVWF